MNRLYEIVIGEAPDGSYVGLVFSATENKRVQVQDQNLRVVLAKIGKLVRRRQKLIRNFPIPKIVKDCPVCDNGERQEMPVALAASN